MSVFESIFLGIIQGIAEFLPISSSGHLALIHNFFGEGQIDYVAFDVFLHLATLIAVCVVFRKDVLEIIKGFFSLVKRLFSGRIKEKPTYGEKLFIMLVIASLPLIPMAFLSDRVESFSRNSLFIGAMLIINGILLYILDKTSKGQDTIESSDYQKPFYIGLFQLFGVLPGISRSGSTIAGGLFFGFKREDAVKFSFLMSIPAIVGAGIFKVPDMVRSDIDGQQWLIFMAGAIAAALVGFFAIKLLQKLARGKGFGVFCVYCIFIGLTAVVTELLS